MGRAERPNDYTATDAAPVLRPDKGAALRFYLRRMPLDSGGYDSGGAYWGLGTPLWHAISTCGAYESFFRTSDRAAAKRLLRFTYPAARFFR